MALQSIQVTPIATKGNCSEVPFGRNFTECIEKCYEGDVIVPVPRPTIELPRAVRGSVFSSGDNSVSPTEVHHSMQWGAHAEAQGGHGWHQQHHACATAGLVELHAALALSHIALS